MHDRVHTEALERSARLHREIELASGLLRRLFRRLPFSLSVRLWNDVQMTLGAGDSTAQASPFTLVFRNPKVICSTVLGQDPLRLVKAYLRGDLDIEGDFFAALRLKKHLEVLHLPLTEKIAAAAAALHLRFMSATGLWAARSLPALRRRVVKLHSKSENRAASDFHYDASNEFYALWLDRAMVYSCAYFERPDTDLETAQEAKLDHICRKLSLRQGESLLDIRCGWGALLIHAAERYGVRAHGVTLSAPQLQVARERIRGAGLEDRVSVELRDYRDVAGESLYDKVASVGMFEHVGLQNLPVYFSAVHRLLKPHGLFLNHGITHNLEGWQKSLSTEFINRYVFSDGQLDNINNIQHCTEQACFEIADVEALRPHYALTLRHWVSRVEGNHARAPHYVEEATYRIWELYMAACALDFEGGDIGIYQVLAAKRASGNVPIPLTRRYLYNYGYQAGRPRLVAPCSADFAQRAHLLAPPSAEHAAEVGALESVPGRVVRTQCGQLPMRDRHQGAGGCLSKLNLDLGLFMRGEVRIAPGDAQTPGRFSNAHAAHLQNMRSAVAVDGFEQWAAHLRLDAQEAAVFAGVTKLHAAPPPAVYLLGEYFERQRRRDRDCDADACAVAVHVLGLRSRCAFSA